MSIKGINPYEIFSIAHQLNSLKKDLNSNVLKEVDKIKHITSLEYGFVYIQANLNHLEANRLKILKNGSEDPEVFSKLQSLQRIKKTWGEVYHICMKAKLFSIGEKCNKAELALITDSKASLKSTKNSYQKFKIIKNNLTELMLNPLLNEEEKNYIKDLLSHVTSRLDAIDEQGNISPFDLCSDEILLQLLSFLPLKDLMNLAQCNKYWRKFCTDKSFWQRFLQREFPSTSIFQNESAKETYISQKKSMMQGMRNGQYNCSTLVTKTPSLYSAYKTDTLLFLGLLNELQVYDITNATNISYITTLKQAAGVSCLKKDGDFLFSAIGCHILKIWNLKDLSNIECIKTLEDPQASFTCFENDENLVFSGSNDTTIQIRDLNTDLFYVLKGHTKAITSLQKVRNLLFSGSSDMTIKIWDLTDLDNIHCITTLQHEGTVTCFYEENNFLFSGSTDQTIKIWDLRDLNKISCVAILKGHNKSITYIYKDENLLFSGSFDKTIKIWNLTTNKCLCTLYGHQDKIIYIKKEGNRLFSGSLDGTIKVWDLNVSLETTFLNFINTLVDIRNSRTMQLYQDGLKSLFERVKNLPPEAQNEVYEEFYNIHDFFDEGFEGAKALFLQIHHDPTLHEKKIRAISRCLLKQVIILFQTDHSEDAKDLFSKLPQQIKSKFQTEFSKNAIYDSENQHWIGVIKKYLNSTKVLKYSPPLPYPN